MKREYDPLNTVDEEKLKAALEKEEAIEKSDICWLMSTASGRRIMWGLLETAGVNTTSVARHNLTYVNEGRRQVGLIYLNKIKAYCFDRYQLMEKENGGYNS